MKKPVIGIIGNGFVGEAQAFAFASVSKIKIYDTDSLIRNTEDYTIERLDNGVWVGVAFQGAYGIDQYTVEVQTLVDNVETEFRVIANMNEGNFVSLINGIGVSIDNTQLEEPSVPFKVIGGVTQLGILGCDTDQWNDKIISKNPS